MLFTGCIILILQFLISINAKWVVDVDSSIIEEIKQNPSVGYLIKFHAPWCGHCRHFEPVYEEIAKEISDLPSTVNELNNIRIVRIDATVHSNVANYYDIRGYPTIKFIRGSQIISYENQRTKSAVIDFLKRVNGPALRWIDSIDKFDEIRREHEVFFLLVTSDNGDEQLIKEYEDVINRYISQAYFYATNSSIIQEKYFSEYQFNDKSQIFVIKNDEIYLYKSDEYNNSLEEFVLREKVATFPEIAPGNMYDLILTKKIIVIYGFDEQKNKRDDLKSKIYNYVIKHTTTLHNTFQFAWTTDLDLLNNIAVWTLEEPLFFLYDSINRKYGIHPLSSVIEQNIGLESTLDYITSNYSEIIQHTGNTFTKRLFRPFWEFYRTLITMFIEAPLLSMLIIGLPAAVLSVVCYCLCCLPNETLMDEREFLYENKKDEDETSTPSDNEQKTMIEKKDD